MKIARISIAVGVASSLAVWGLGKFINKVTHDAYKEGFSEGVEAHQNVMEFANKLQEAIDENKAED